MSRSKPNPDQSQDKLKITKELQKALAGRKAGVDSEALLNDLVEVWGGPRQLAVDIHAEYQSAPPGGMVRQRIMEMLQRLIMNNTLHDIGKVTRPSEMTKEDLEAVAMRYVKRLTGGTDVAAPSSAP